MAHDIVLGRIKRDWSRGSETRLSTIVRSLSAGEEPELRLTEAEMKKLADLALVRQRADSGDRAARRQMKKLAARVASLETSAKKGDAGAARSLLVLRGSGVLRGVSSVSMGDDALSVPNKVYRAAIYNKAVKVAGGRRPTTKDFFRAKTAVDRTMNRAGLNLHLPGSRPGRVTA